MAKKFDIKIGEPIFGRVVFHYQITDEAFGKLCDFFRAVLKGGGPHAIPPFKSSS